MDEIVGVATDYFGSIFSLGGSNKMEECIDTVPHKVAADMLEIMSSEYRAEEIKAVLLQMGPTQAPRPDDMNALFYQKFWHIVGDDVIAVVLDFLNSGILLLKIN